MTLLILLVKHKFYIDVIRSIHSIHYDGSNNDNNNKKSLKNHINNNF